MVWFALRFQISNLHGMNWKVSYVVWFCLTVLRGVGVGMEEEKRKEHHVTTTQCKGHSKDIG